MSLTCHTVRRRISLLCAHPVGLTGTVQSQFWRWGARTPCGVSWSGTSSSARCWRSASHPSDPGGVDVALLPRQAWGNAHEKDSSQGRAQPLDIWTECDRTKDYSLLPP